MKSFIHVSPRITAIVLLHETLHEKGKWTALLFTMIALLSRWCFQSHTIVSHNCPTFKLSPVRTIIIFNISPKPSWFNPCCLCCHSTRHYCGHQVVRAAPQSSRPLTLPYPSCSAGDRRTCATSTVGGTGKSLQIDRLSAGVLWSNLLLNLALGFLPGCQVNMSDLGKETFGEVWNGTERETAVEGWGAQMVVHCTLVGKHKQCTCSMFAGSVMCMAQ